MWSLQEAISKVEESAKYKAVHELYRDVELEPGGGGGSCRAWKPCM